MENKYNFQPNSLSIFRPEWGSLRNNLFLDVLEMKYIINIFCLVPLSQIELSFAVYLDLCNFVRWFSAAAPARQRINFTLLEIKRDKQSMIEYFEMYFDNSKEDKTINKGAIWRFSQK